MITTQIVSHIQPLYSVSNVPLFQNKVYPTVQEAIEAKTGDVVLAVNPVSGIIYNAVFDNCLMDYDEHYQNEQNYSPYFQQYVDEVANLVTDFIGNDTSKNIIEIGCGKGYFLEFLRAKGYRVTGYDPTYEGQADYIIKDYFGADVASSSGDLLILRHTMEHIPDPFSFLKLIANANGNKGKLFIEVPTFDWIVENKAFWDVFYEHCNYFTESSFANLFTKAQTGRLFNGQYMYLFADLADLKSTVESKSFPADAQIEQLTNTLDQWAEWLRHYQQEGIAVWGAGAKGSTFVNRLDSATEMVRCIVDISPKKYNKFIAGTGHAIIAPDSLRQRTDIRHILVMNPNYLAEIEAQFVPGTYQIWPLQ